MSYPFDLDKIRVMYRITGELENLTPIRVGSGRAQSLSAISDSPIIQVNGLPCIPGSSIKGAVRSLAESYARVRGWSVKDFSELTAMVGKLKTEEIKEVVRSCPTCALFGSPVSQSHVIFYDAVVRGDYRVSIRTMVSINRITGAQHESHLYKLDYVERGARFGFMMDVVNVDLRSPSEGAEAQGAELLRYIVAALKGGELQLGGKKSAGFGLVKLSELKVAETRIGPEGLVSREVSPDELKL